MITQGMGYDTALRDILIVLFKHKYMIAIVFLIMVVSTTFINTTTTPIYQAEASLLLKVGREYVYRPEVGESRPPVQLLRQELVNSEAQILLSRTLARRVVQQIGIETLYPGIGTPPPMFSIRGLRAALRDALSPSHANASDDPVEKAAFSFSSNLKVGDVAKSNVVHLSFDHPNPAMAARAVNTLIEEFKSKRLEIFSGPHSEILESRLVQYERQLGDAEVMLEGFRQEHGVFAFGQQRTLLLEQLTDLDTELRKTENALEEEAKRLASLDQQKSRLQKNIPLSAEDDRFPVVDDAKSKLLALKLKEQQLLTRYHEDSMFVQDVREELKLVEEFLESVERDVATRVNTGINPIREQLELDIIRAQAAYDALIARKAAIKVQIERLKEDLRALDLRENELAEIEREVRHHAKNYEQTLVKVEEARISDELDRLKIVNISIIEPAIAPLRPVRPRKALNIVLSAIFGLAAGIAIAFGMEFFRGGFITPVSAERRLKLRVLTSIPYQRA